MGLRSWLRSVFDRLWRRRDNNNEEAPPVSLVLLLREPRPLGLNRLAAVIRRAIGVEVWTGEGEPKGGAYLVGEGDPAIIAQIGDRTFLVNNFAMPYVPDPEAAAAEIDDLRLRAAMAEHRAWLSVDLLRDDTPGDPADAYRTIAPLIAELADDDALALFNPASGRLDAFSLDVADALRSTDPIAALAARAYVPIVAIGDDDPALRAAVEEARSRWPEFVSAFEGRSPGDVFSAKVRLAEGDAVEFIWVPVTAVEGDYLFGRLDNEPMGLRSVRRGSKVRVPLDDLNDWLIRDASGVRGGFTIDVLRRAQG